jgi:CRP-like cAMP-binding protein
MDAYVQLITGRTASVAERPVALPPAWQWSAAMPHQENQLLARLRQSDFDAIRPNLRVVDLVQHQVLADDHNKIETVYFPHSGILSFIVELKNGMAIETGMVGRDGVFGSSQALDGKVSLNKVTVQVSGQASVMDADRLRHAANSMPDFRALLIKYDLLFLAHVQQTAACNAAHDVQTRMSKWLLRMHELVGVDLPLTQEFLAQMMGVQRTSVSGVASEMQRSGLISYSRGHVHIENIELVKLRACECHGEMQAHSEKILAA